MSTRSLVAGTLPKAERRGRVERHLLALSGGGYRGLFTADILRQLEEEGGAPLASRFDMLAGTSIGGILAIGLACGVPAARMAEVIREHAPAIFRRRPLTLGGLAGARYGSTGLAGAIEAVLTPALANRPFRAIPASLIVCAVDELTSMPRIFRTDAASGGGGDDVPTIDVALATSAAPTYFPPHRIGGRNHVDGGLVANAPDMLLLGTAVRLFGATVEGCHLLSVGTAGSPRQGRVTGSPGKLGWAARHALVDLIMSAQESLALHQAEALGPGTFLRIDADPAEVIRLDATDTRTTGRLLALARQAIDTAHQTRAEDLRRFLAHVPAARTAR